MYVLKFKKAKMSQICYKEIKRRKKLTKTQQGDEHNLPALGLPTWVTDSSKMKSLVHLTLRAQLLMS